MFKAIKEWFLNTRFGKWLFSNNNQSKDIVQSKSNYKPHHYIFRENELDYDAVKNLPRFAHQTQNSENSGQLKTSPMMFLYKAIVGALSGKPIDINVGGRKDRYLSYSSTAKNISEKTTVRSVKYETYQGLIKSGRSRWVAEIVINNSTVCDVVYNIFYKK